MNLTMIPMWIFSGIFFSSERFPDAIQPVIKAIPLTPLINSLRSVMLEGAPLSAQLASIGIMAAWGAISFFLALRWFRWR
jgi:ABC-type polysaccharide/polyol phosphate export permease